MQTLFERISVRGLTNEVLNKVEEVRPDVSRNTVNLALKDERSAEERTPLRNYIREIAEVILQQEEESAQEA